MRAVDLAAVRSARSALDALAAAHPELTQPPARDRLARALPEIIDMKPLDPNATGAARTITVRLSADLIAHLEAERARLAALVPGSSLGLSDAVRSLIHRATSTPFKEAMAATAAASAPFKEAMAAASAPFKEAMAATSNQQPKPSAPVVALHTTAGGASVATLTGNDNAAPIPKAKRPRREAPAVVDDEAASQRAAMVAERLRALRDDEIARAVPLGSRQWSLRPIAALAVISTDPIARLLKGERISPAMVDKLAAILPPE